MIAAVGGRRRDELAQAHRQTDPAELMHRADAAGCRAVCRHDAAYPAALHDLGDQAPAALFARGAVELLRELDRDTAVTIVGARRASSYGLGVAAGLGAVLSRAGVVVVSGLANGIDSRAHTGALDGGGPTIAVLGGGVDVPYPRRQAGLHRRIEAEGGLLLSELPPGGAVARWCFPARNRIMAALGGLDGRRRGGGAIRVADHRRDGARPGTGRRSGSRPGQRVAVEWRQPAPGRGSRSDSRCPGRDRPAARARAGPPFAAPDRTSSPTLPRFSPGSRGARAPAMRSRAGLGWRRTPRPQRSPGSSCSATCRATRAAGTRAPRCSRRRLPSIEPMAQQRQIPAAALDRGLGLRRRRGDPGRPEGVRALRGPRDDGDNRAHRAEHGRCRRDPPGPARNDRRPGSRRGGGHRDRRREDGDARRRGDDRRGRRRIALPRRRPPGRRPRDGGRERRGAAGARSAGGAGRAAASACHRRDAQPAGGPGDDGARGGGLPGGARPRRTGAGAPRPRSSPAGTPRTAPISCSTGRAGETWSGSRARAIRAAPRMGRGAPTRPRSRLCWRAASHSRRRRERRSSSPPRRWARACGRSAPAPVRSMSSGSPAIERGWRGSESAPR